MAFEMIRNFYQKRCIKIFCSNTCASWGFYLMDVQNCMCRLAVSKFQSKTSVTPFYTTMSMGPSPDGIRVNFLGEFIRGILEKLKPNKTPTDLGGGSARPPPPYGWPYYGPPYYGPYGRYPEEAHRKAKHKKEEEGKEEESPEEGQPVDSPREEPPAESPRDESPADSGGYESSDSE